MVDPLSSLTLKEKLAFLEASRQGLKLEYPSLNTSKNLPQQRFVSSPKLIVVGVAGNRSGKSDAAAWRAANFTVWGKPAPPYVGSQLIQTPNNGWIISVDYPSSKEIMEPKFFRMVPPWRIDHWDKDDRIVDIWHPGNKIGKVGFKSADSGREKFQGADKHWEHLDEEIKEEIFTESRLRLAANSKLFIWMTLTPLKGMTWVYDKFFKPYYEEAKPTEIVEIIYPWSIYDNKDNLDADEIKRLETELTEYEKLVRLYGKFLPSGGQPVFDIVKLFELQEKCQDGEKWEWNPLPGEERWFKSEQGNLDIWEPSDLSCSYLITADTAEGGTQGDYSAADVFEIYSGRQCAQWHGHIDPYQFGELLADLGDLYNGAAIIPETYPGPGGAVLDRLKIIYTNLCERPDWDRLPDSTRDTDRLGWKTTSPAKQRMIAAIKLALREGWTIRSKRTINELITFVKTETGQFKSQYGCYDDCVTSYGIGCAMIAGGLVSGVSRGFSTKELRRIRV